MGGKCRAREDAAYFFYLEILNCRSEGRCCPFFLKLNFWKGEAIFFTLKIWKGEARENAVHFFFSEILKRRSENAGLLFFVVILKRQSERRYCLFLMPKTSAYEASQTFKDRIVQEEIGKFDENNNIEIIFHR